MAPKKVIAIDAEPSRCHGCGGVLWGHSGPCRPKPGDVSICENCLTPSIFSDECGHVRAPESEEELVDCRAALEDLLGKGGAV